MRILPFVPAGRTNSMMDDEVADFAKPELLSPIRNGTQVSSITLAHDIVC